MTKPGKISRLLVRGILNPKSIPPFLHNYLINNYEHILGAEGLQKPRFFDPNNRENPLKNPTKCWSVRAPNLQKAHAVTIKDKKAYVTGRKSGTLSIFDVSDLSSLSHISTIGGSELTGAHDITVVDEIAYITCEQPSFDQRCHDGCRVTIADVSNSSTPEIVSSLRDTKNLRLVKRHDYHNDFLYCAVAGAASLTIIDVSDQKSPKVVGSVSDKIRLSRANDVFYNNGYAFVSSYDGDYCIIDVTNPTTPKLISSITGDNLRGPKNSVVDDRGIAYVAARKSSSLTTIDISDPENPNELSSISSLNLDGPQEVAIDDSTHPKYAYVLNRHGTSFVTLDVSNPSKIQEVGMMDRRFDMRDPQYLHYDDGIGYIAADGSNCLSIVVGVEK